MDRADRILASLGISLDEHIEAMKKRFEQRFEMRFADIINNRKLVESCLHSGDPRRAVLAMEFIAGFWEPSPETRTIALESLKEHRSETARVAAAQLLGIYCRAHGDIGGKKTLASIAYDNNEYDMVRRYAYYWCLDDNHLIEMGVVMVEDLEIDKFDFRFLWNMVMRNGI